MCRCSRVLVRQTGLTVSDSGESLRKPDERWREPKRQQYPLPGVMCVGSIERESDACGERHQQEIGASDIAVQSTAPRRIDQTGNAHHDTSGSTRQQQYRKLHCSKESGDRDSSRYDPQAEHMQRLANAVAASGVTNGFIHST